MYKDLAENRGLVVRYRGDQLGCQGCLRITVGSAEDNKVVVQTLKEVLQII